MTRLQNSVRPISLFSVGRVRRCFGLTKFILWKWKAVPLVGPPTVDDQMYGHEFCHKCFTQKDAVFTSHDKGRRSTNTICEWRSWSLWRSAKACKAFTVADGCAVKSDARVTCQIIWQPGYLTPNMWMDSLIPPPPPIHCDFADQVRLSWSRLLFLSKTILVLCARLISNASQKSTITRYLARGLLTLQYINGGHQITWFVRVNYGDKWHLGNCYSGYAW